MLKRQLHNITHVSYIQRVSSKEHETGHLIIDQLCAAEKNGLSVPGKLSPLIAFLGEKSWRKYLRGLFFFPESILLRSLHLLAGDPLFCGSWWRWWKFSMPLWLPLVLPPPLLDPWPPTLPLLSCGAQNPFWSPLVKQKPAPFWSATDLPWSISGSKSQASYFSKKKGESRFRPSMIRKLPQALLRKLLAKHVYLP